MPPPPAIGAVRPPKGTKAAGAEGDPNGEMPQTTSGAKGDQAAEPPERASHAEGERLEESATARWPTLTTEIAEDDGPSEEVGSRSLPVAAMRPLAPPPPSVSASSTSSLRVPDASSTSGFLRVPSLGPTAGDSAASWPKTDGWDLDDAAPEGGGAGKAETHREKEASSVPSAQRPAGGSVPSVQRPSAAKEVGSVPSVQRPAGGSIPSVQRPGAAREVGSVPSVPKTGAGAKVGPLPKLGGARPAQPPKHGGAAEDAPARPLFGTTPSPGSLASSPTRSLDGEATDASSGSPLDAWASFSTPSLDAASVDASAPPSSASPLDALPSFDAAPTLGGVTDDGVPSMDSSALLGAALAPVAPFEPAPLGDEDSAEPAPSVPRLPMPGMLRDGLAPAADFRATPRTPRSPQPPPAMSTPRGMVPPKLREGEEPRLKPGDTQALVAQVAEELMEQVDRQRAEKAAASASAVPSPEHDRETAVVIAAPTSPTTQPTPRPAAAGAVPTASPYLSAREAETRRRTKILGLGAIGVAAAIGLLVWMNAGTREEAPTQTAASTITPVSESPAKDGDAKVEPPAPSPAPVADEADAGAEPSEPAEPAEAAADGAGDPVEAEPADEAGADAGETPSEPEPTEAASGSSGSSRKSSGRSTKSGGKTGSSGSGTKEEPAPKPEPKPEEGQSAAKLLKQARSAYNAGKGSTAYSLASKSNRMEPSGEAAEVMALAACQMKDADKAKSALKTVPLFSRGTVRSTCKTKHGVKLGL